MKILIVSATLLEIEPLVQEFMLLKEINQKLRKYTYKNIEIDVLVPGVGMTCTAYWLGKTFSKNLYDCAINVGIAGAFSNQFEVGSVLHVTNDTIAELGAEDGEKFLSLIDMDLIMDEDYHLHGKIVNTIPIANEIIEELPTVSAITVNTTHGNTESINIVKKEFNPDIESMEGAAFFYACLLEGITCAQIRSISNMVEHRNKENWNIPLAISNLNSTVLNIINTLK